LNPPTETPLSKYLNEEAIGSFATAAYAKSNISVVANGASQADLGKWVGEFFGDVADKPAFDLSSPATKYFGGEERISNTSETNAYAIAFPGSSSFTSGSSYKPEIAVLAALLGGKSAIKWSPGFSLLAKAAASLGANISTTHAAYSDAGLLAINLSGSASAVRGASIEVVKVLKSIAEGSISKEDFTKAVARAKYESLEQGQNIEAGLVATGAGLIQGGKPFQFEEVTKAIESVSQDSLKAVRLPLMSLDSAYANVKQAAKSLLEGKASVAAVGDLYALPFAEEIGLKV
jgi:ubiquinol-cytochrome c reductase core subunit 2